MTATDVESVDLPAPARPMEEWLFHEDGPMSKDQALEVVAKVKGFAGQLHRILERAHERRIWMPLGYESWAAMCAVEFDVSRSRSYQLLALAKVQTALTSGEQPDAPPPVDDVEELTEAQARPLAPFKGDPRATRLIWARAQEIAGPNATPTQAQVEQAANEWKAPGPGDELWRSETRLVTAGDAWTDGPVWWTWQTPSDGVKLYLGLGDVPGGIAMHERALFKSEARYGDFAAIAAEDLDALVPRLIAELFARQVPAAEEVYEVGRLVDDLNIGWGKRGPFTLTHQQVSEAFLELAQVYDDDGTWSDTSSDAAGGDELTAAWEAFDAAVVAYKTQGSTRELRDVAELRRHQLAGALLADVTDRRGLLGGLQDLMRRYRAELDDRGPVDTKKNGPDDLRRFDRFRDELLHMLAARGVRVPEPWASQVRERDAISFNQAGEYPSGSVFPRLRIDDLIDLLAGTVAPVDPDDEVVDAEIIEDDEPAPADPGRRERLLERLRSVEAELAGDVPATRRLQLVQERLNLEAELEGRTTSPSAAPASRRPAAAPSPDSPSGDTPAGDDGPPVPSSPATSRTDLTALTDAELIVGVCQALNLVTESDELGEPIDAADLRETARWLRAAASRMESRAQAAEREGAAA